MNLINCLHGIQVVDTRIKTNFIHDNDASGFNPTLKRLDRGRDITCRDDVCLAFDGSFNDRNMESVRDERNNCIYSRDGGLERRGISDIKRYSRRAGKALCQRFCTFEGATSWASSLTRRYEGRVAIGRTNCEFVRWITDYVFCSRTCDEAASEEKHFLFGLTQFSKSLSAAD